MLTVFINYRRQDTDAFAGRLYDTLTARLPDLRIFMDVSAVKAGDDFTNVLRKTLSSTDVMLVVIGPTWLTTVKPDGTRRLDDPDDFVIMEIAEALKRDVAVLPVLVQDAAMPSPGELPAAIRDLAKRQAMPLSNANWRDDVSSLLERLEVLLAERGISNEEELSSQPRWKRPLRRVPLAFDRLRRRVIPRSRTWRIVKGVTAAVAIVALLVSGYAAFLYIRGAERREVQRAAANMRYEQPLEVVTAAILTLRDLGVRSSSPDITHLVVARLKAIVLTRTDTTDKGRAIRKHALETIKALRQNDLTKDFSGAELKEADLVDVDLSRAVLKGVSFEDGFLIRTNFAASDLTGSDLSGAWVRNADFGAATLNGANVDGLDWFNADGFASDQLRSVDLSTVTPCPKNDADKATEEAFRSRLAKEYDFQWEQLGSDRSALQEYWARYSKPGGLCEQVDSWLVAFKHR